MWRLSVCRPIFYRLPSKVAINPLSDGDYLHVVIRIVFFHDFGECLGFLVRVIEVTTKMSSSEEDHLKYRRMPFKFGIRDQSCLSDQQTAILYKYGSWMEALAKGYLKARTKAQEDFVSAAAGLRKPETAFEIAWDRLKMRRDFERTQNWWSNKFP
jgi:uncharacterized protein YifE (UPF0438 family)